VIAVEMRNDHDIDCVTVDARGLQIGMILADPALTLLEHAKAETGIDGHKFRSSVDDHRRIGVRHLVLCQKKSVERCVHIRLWRIRHICVGQRVRVHPVGDNRHLEVAHLITVPTSILLGPPRVQQPLPAKRSTLTPLDRHQRQRHLRTDCVVLFALVSLPYFARAIASVLSPQPVFSGRKIKVRRYDNLGDWFIPDF
jgi:hypothetical protein